MGRLGVSVFVGLGQTEAQNRRYLRRAWESGYTELFTSLHVPETDRDAFQLEMPKLLAFARELGFRVTADVSPETARLFGLMPETLGNLGVSAIRFDWGYELKPMLTFLQDCSLDVELNASTTGEAELEALLAAGIDPARLRAGHNYYPRPETGLSEALFASRSHVFAERGIPVSAFIPGFSCRRGPIGGGLPTLERHRKMSSLSAAKHLWAIGEVSCILFGDPLATDAELAEVASLPMDGVTLDVRFAAGVGVNLKTPFLEGEHRNRRDAAELCVRSTAGRSPGTTSDWPGEPGLRPRGAVTIDNERYGRYAGEIQIALRDLPADERVNVVGQVAPQDLQLLDYIGPGRRFQFREAKG